MRSYVKRGRITQKQSHALAELLPLYGLPLRPLQPALVFGNEAPIILDIGFGMGESLLHMAEQQPDKNFIGIEVHDPGVGHVLAELKERQIANVRIFHADAKQVLNECIPDHCVSKIQIFFPDPWPKRRHHKRRLIQTEFVQLLEKKLIANGELHIATDWEDYANHIVKTMAAIQKFDTVQVPHDRPITKFEKRGRKLGYTVFDFVFVKW